jgi:transcription antitermination factor NusG
MHRWYIIHAYSGFENKVRESILSEAERMGLEQLVEQVEVPTETVTEVKRGKKVQVERKFMPGYVLAKLMLSDDVYHLVKNTPKVTGFLGTNGAISALANRPPPNRASRFTSITRSAIRSRSTRVRSPASPAPSKSSISKRTGSRSASRSSAAPRLWNWRSKRSNWRSRNRCSFAPISVSARISCGLRLAGIHAGGGLRLSV